MEKREAKPTTTRRRPAPATYIQEGRCFCEGCATERPNHVGMRRISKAKLTEMAYEGHTTINCADCKTLLADGNDA